MNYNRLYPLKVWLTGLSIAALFLSFAHDPTGIKGSMHITANDFTPFFIVLSCCALVLLPALIIFYLSFSFLRKRSVGYKNAKLILIAVVIISILSYVMIPGILDDMSANPKFMRAPLVFILPIAASAAYYNLGITSERTENPDFRN